MGRSITLTAGDGHGFAAYRADPPGAAKGGLVVVQEIFGVNGHIRELVDRFAGKGYAAVAPALFDRKEPGVELAYDEASFGRGRELRGQLDDSWILADVDAAAAAVSSAGKVGLIGYCFGGYVAWISACGLDSLACSVSCYGGGVAARAAGDTPRCPVQFHFGDKDHAIPMGDVQKIRDAHPDVPSFVYDDAAHGFCCDHRDVYDAGACERAHARAFALFAEHVG